MSLNANTSGFLIVKSHPTLSSRWNQTMTSIHMEAMFHRIWSTRRSSWEWRTKMLTLTLTDQVWRGFTTIPSQKVSPSFFTGFDFDRNSCLSASSSTVSSPACRICQLPGIEPTNPLISPCRCLGSIRYVHNNCLLVRKLDPDASSMSVIVYVCLSEMAWGVCP